MHSHLRLLRAAIAVACVHALACAPVDSTVDLDADDGPFDDFGEEDATTEKGLESSNGLRAINGLTSTNGLRSKNGLNSINGLTIANGLTTMNGLTSVNGLTTKNGLAAINGLFVDCYGRADSQCTAADGLLSPTTGLMSSPDGIVTATYLTRCALPASKVIRIKSHTGAFVSLQGELGVAPEWAVGLCAKDCQERVSACMLSLINQDGYHRRLTLTAAWPGNPFGTTHEDYNIVESHFFGNIFKTPVEAYVVSAYDHARTVVNVEAGAARSEWGLALRSCNAYKPTRQYNDFLTGLSRCAAKHIGSAAPSADGWSALRSDATKYSKCSFADSGWNGVASRSTASRCSGEGTSAQNYVNVITTWRSENPWLPKCNVQKEGNTAYLSCGGGGKIKAISYASYGNSANTYGTCPKYKNGTCHAANSKAVVERLCLGKERCDVVASNAVFGDPCEGVAKTLSVHYTCD